MKTNLVVDSSIVFKWYDQTEIDSDKALSLWDQLARKETSIIVPDLILYELANAWSTKTKLSIKEIENNLQVLQEVDLLIESVSFDLISKAVFLSKKCKVSVYDAIYAVLAKEKKCVLITADEKFVEKVKMPFVRKLKDI